MQSKHVILDVAHFTNTVYKWIVENGWRGAWGDEKKGFIHTELSGQRVIRVYSPVQYRDPMLGTSFASEGNEKARYVYWANDPIKDLLAVLRYSEPPIFHVHTDVPVDYQRHMNAEIKTTKRSFQTNRVTYFWRRLRKDNHLLDAECMNLRAPCSSGSCPCRRSSRRRPSAHSTSAQTNCSHFSRARSALLHTSIKFPKLSAQKRG